MYTGKPLFYFQTVTDDAHFALVFVDFQDFSLKHFALTFSNQCFNTPFKNTSPTCEVIDTLPRQNVVLTVMNFSIVIKSC